MFFTSAPLCPSHRDPMECSPPGSSVHGIFQARILEWIAISSSRGSSWSRARTWVSCIGKQILYHWATREVLRRHTDGQRHTERYSTSLIIRETQIKATRSSSCQSERPSIRSLQITNAGKGEEKREPSHPVGRNVSWCSHSEKQYEVSSEN